MVEGDAETLRDEAYFEHTFKRAPKFIICVSEGIRTERWKYIRYPEQEPVYEELFDLEKDPVELENLVDTTLHMATSDPAYVDNVKAMIKIAFDDVPLIPLWQPYLDVAMQKNVTGYEYWFHRQLDCRRFAKA